MDSRQLKIKVCGMREPGNIEALVALEPDWLGLIFYPESKRFVGAALSESLVKRIPPSIKKVGVFVNEDEIAIVKMQKKYSLDFIQLHGDEKPEACQRLKKEGLKVIKAFSVDESFDFNVLEPYISSCDYFLFDTKGEGYGGNGIQFNWNILDNYSYQTPFILSGGVDLASVPELKKMRYEKLFAIDVNSKFEQSPGVKDIPKLQKFFKEVRS